MFFSNALDLQTPKIITDPFNLLVLVSFSQHHKPPPPPDKEWKKNRNNYCICVCNGVVIQLPSYKMTVDVQNTTLLSECSFCKPLV